MERYDKVAVFGGVYNNYLALERLLKECARIGVDAIFCLGDMGGFGPYPDRCFPFLRSGKIFSIAGNYDISLAKAREDCGCGYTDSRDNHAAQISYEYTFQNTSLENKAWLGRLPHSHCFSLGSLNVLLCHGSPRKTNEFLWESTTPDHLLARFMNDYQADVICCTHTGIKWHRELNQGHHFVNVGVIGRPENDGTRNVWFTLLEHTRNELSCTFRTLDYDSDTLAREMVTEGLPDEFVVTTQTGWWTTCLEIMPCKERRQGKY